ncbi:HAMP domain-containing sensor histidine kinase [Compostibacter hankyongensis]|uniref:histidine kinase n=1 Tax=Compostibacter hankyongensis TaxID=1007089 RepID=A0ABP8G0I3_9BACT
MSSRSRRKIDTKRISVFYFFLFIYTIAALIWWGYLLFEQSRDITQYEKNNLELKIDRDKHPAAYRYELLQIEHRENLRSLKYWGEGLTFLVVILIGSAFVYRAVRKQMRLSRQQHNFMMAVTHELKSPIAVTKLNLETLLKRQLDDGRRQKLLENTLRETNRLNHLCNNMLLASQMENRQYHMVKEPLDFSRLLQQCIEDNKARISDHEIKGEVIPEVWVSGDDILLRIAVNNLVENAAKYSPRDTEIDVRLSQDDAQLLLQVADQGMGVADVEKKKIFDRFYRVGNENTRKTKGTGLGLFLTKKIVQQHGGIIRVVDNIPKGSIFEIVIPVHR